ncbi:hypothetical protein Tco_0666928, partial [Tanacetum coccineum]
EKLKLAKESRLKMHAKQNDPIVQEKKVNIAPIDYVALNRMSEHFVKHFVPQKQLSAEHAFWFPISKPVFEIPPVQREPVLKEIPCELPTIKLLMSQDLVHSAVNSLADIIDYQSTEKSFLDEYSECVELKAELSKKNEMVEKEHADTLREIVEHARALRPLDNDLDSACKFAMRVQELLVYVRDTYPSLSRKSEKLIARTPINKVKKDRVAEPSTSSSNTHKHVDSCKTKDSNKPLFPSIGVIKSTSANRSKPQGNTKKNRISRPTSSNKKNKVEVHFRSVKLSLNKKNRISKPVCNENVKHSILNVNSELICAICNECMVDAIHNLCVLDYVNDVNVCVTSKSVKSKKKKVWKPTGKVFTNVGYSWKPIGRTFTIVGNTCPLTRINSTTIVPSKKPLSTTVVKKTPSSSNTSGKLKDITNIGSSSKFKSVASKISNNSATQQN